MKAVLILLAFSCVLFSSHATSVSSDVQCSITVTDFSSIAEPMRTLDSGCACVDERTSTGYNAMYYAVLHDNIDVTSLLADIGSDLSQLNEGDATLLHIAASAGSTRVSRWLVEHGGIDVNALDEIAWTPLHVSAAQGSLDEVRLLVELGACINCRDMDGHTTLRIAILYDHLDVAEYLKSRGGVE